MQDIKNLKFILFVTALWGILIYAYIKEDDSIFKARKRKILWIYSLFMLSLLLPIFVYILSKLM